MLTIQISEFCEYTLKDFTNLLSIQNETKFKIIFPKPVMLPGSSTEEMGNIYAIATYAGECLAAVSNKFGYYTPSPFTANNFYYIIETDQFHILALQLYIITSFFFRTEHYNFKKISNSIKFFLSMVDNGNISCSVPGILAINKCFTIPIQLK